MYPPPHLTIPEAEQLNCKISDSWKIAHQQRLQDTAQNFHYSPHGFSASANSTTPKLWFFSVPFASGWQAYANGTPIEIIPVNYAFMGIFLPAGSYEIQFTYRTPGQNAGIVLSLLAMIGLLGVGRGRING